MPKVIGEYIDQLCTIEMRPSAGNLPRGQLRELYDAARAITDGPLVHAMARALVDAIEPGDRVLILTGAGGPPVLPVGEVDGLPGAAALARVLTLQLGAQVIILTEQRTEMPMQAVCNAAGLNFQHPGDEARAPTPVWFVPMSLDAAKCEAQAPRLLDEFQPKVVLAIEKLSPNRNGVIHGSTGISYNDNTPSRSSCSPRRAAGDPDCRDRRRRQRGGVRQDRRGDGQTSSRPARSASAPAAAAPSRRCPSTTWWWRRSRTGAATAWPR